MKHGPIAMIDENVPSVFIIPSDAIYEKTLSNLQEVKARKGPIIAIATEGDKQIGQHAEDVIYVSGHDRTALPLCWLSCRCNCWPTTWPLPGLRRG